MMKATFNIWFIWFLQNRWLQHCLFWGLAFWILLQLFSGDAPPSKVDFIYTLIFLLPVICCVYSNLRVLIPKFLEKNKVFFYSLFVGGLLLLGILFQDFLFRHLIDIILPGYYFISYYTLSEYLVFFLSFLAITTLLKLSKGWFFLQQTRQQLIEVQKEKAIMELQALRGQLNPHFLFNSLNLLYAQAVEQSNETAPTILQLADILRYAIYDGNKEVVPVEEEVKLIEDYLSIQQKRIDNPECIRFEKEVQENHPIAPMLLLPLVENSFKHGLKGDTESTYLHILLKSEAKFFQFVIENNKGAVPEMKQNASGGLGISNIQQRLKLLYPQRHEFVVEETAAKFKVTLKLNYETSMRFINPK